MPNLVPTNAPIPHFNRLYKERARVHSSKLKDSTHLTPMAWRYGPRVDLLELGLLRYGQHSTNAYNYALQRLQELAQGKMEGDLQIWPCPANKGYRQIFALRYGEREVARFSCDPTRKFTKNPGMKLRFNADWIYIFGIEILIKSLLYQLFPTNITNQTPLITRVLYLELSADLQHSLANLYIYGINRQRKTVCGTTRYQGTRNSKCSSTLYDKQRELWERRRIVVEAPVIRLEARFKSFPYQGWKEYLGNQGNPFVPFRVIDRWTLEPAFPPCANPGLWSKARNGDLDAALKSLKGKRRKKFLEHLNTLPMPAWYDPHQLWQEVLETAYACPFLNLWQQEG